MTLTTTTTTAANTATTDNINDDGNDGNGYLSGGGGGGDGEDPLGVEEGNAPDPSTLLVSLASSSANPLTAAKHGLVPSSQHQSQGQGQHQGEGGSGSGSGGGGGGQESILIAAAENKRSLAAQRARQDAADAVLLCLSQSFLPALQVTPPGYYLRNNTHNTHAIIFQPCRISNLLPCPCSCRFPLRCSCSLSYSSVVVCCGDVVLSVAVL